MAQAETASLAGEGAGTGDALLVAPRAPGAGDDRHRLRRSPRRWTLATWFLVVAVPLGAFLVFAVPPFQGLDEPNHFMRVWTITNGTVVPPTVHAGTRSVDIGGERAAVGTAIRPHLEAKGVVVPACVDDFVSLNIVEAAKPGPMNDRTFFSTPPGCSKQPGVFVIFDNTAINSPFVYAPLVLGVGILRAVGAPLPVIFYGGRLFGLAAFLALVALAIRITPRAKPVLFLIGLLPMSLEGAAVYSADPMTEAFTLLVVALTIRCCVDEEAGWALFGWLAAAACGLALCKEPYGLLALMVLLVPAGRLAGRAPGGRALTTRTAAALKVGVVGAAAVLGGAWYLTGVRGVTLTADYPPGQINQAFETRFFEHHPWALVHELLRTWFSSSQQQVIVSGMVSTLGFFRNAVGSEFAPLVLVVLFFVLLFVAYQFEWGPRRILTAPRQVVAWLPVGLAGLVTLLIYVESAIRVTVPGSLVVSPLIGGRLFVPLLAVPAVTAVLLRRPRDRTVPAVWLVLGMLVLGAYMVTKVFIRFY